MILIYLRLSKLTAHRQQAFCLQERSFDSIESRASLIQQKVGPFADPCTYRYVATIELTAAAVLAHLMRKLLCLSSVTLPCTSYLRLCSNQAYDALVAGYRLIAKNVTKLVPTRQVNLVNATDYSLEMLLRCCRYHPPPPPLPPSPPISCCFAIHACSHGAALLLLTMSLDVIRHTTGFQSTSPSHPCIQRRLLSALSAALN